MDGFNHFFPTSWEKWTLHKLLREQPHEHQDQNIYIYVTTASFTCYGLHVVNELCTQIPLLTDTFEPEAASRLSPVLQETEQEVLIKYEPLSCFPPAADFILSYV